MTRSRHRQPIKVGFAFHPPAHYRSSLIHHLERDGRVDVEFMFDPTRSRQPIRHLAPENIARYRRLNFRMRFGLVWQGGLLSRIVREDYDAIVMTGDIHDVSTWFALIAARILRKPALLWTQGWRRSEQGARRLARLAFYRLAQRLLVYGERARDLGISMGYPPERITVTYNSVSDTAEKPIPDHNEAPAAVAARYGFAPTSPVVIFASRLKRLKRADLLVHAAAALACQGSPIELVFIGDGEDRQSLQRLCRELAVPAYFAGALYEHDELGLFYAIAACAALPEHAGLGVIQAMQFGVPVVVNDDYEGNGPEAEAVLDGATGAIYSKGSIEGLARALGRACELGEDQVTRQACFEMAGNIWSARNQARLMVDAIELAVSR